MFNLCKIIVFDVNTLFKENHSIALKSLNKMKLFKYTARGKNPHDLRRELDSLLIDLDGNGIKRPNIIENWLRGEISGKVAYDRVTRYIDSLLEKKPKSTTLQLLKEITAITFSPEILSNVLELNPKAVSLARKISKDPEYKLYLAGNLDTQTLNALKKKHPDIFSLFLDTSLSSEQKKLKPEKDFMMNLVGKWGLAPLQSCYLDDDLNDVKLLSSYGFNVFDLETVSKNIG